MTTKISEITYQEAANLLGVRLSTISQAVSRGALTPLPRRARKPGRLALEQVQLFKNKQITLAELNNEEAIIWHEIDRLVSSIGKKTTNQPVDMTAKSIAILTDVVDRVTDLAVDAVMELQRTQPADLTPDKLVSVLMGSKSFNQIALLMGLDMSNIPDDTKLAIQNILFNAVSKATMRLVAMQIASATSVPDQEKIAS